MADQEWTTSDHAMRYLKRADAFPRRAEGESVLLEHVSHAAHRILDLGTGDGRLLALLRRDRPDMAGVGVDFSGPMLDAAARRFAGDDRVELLQHDLRKPLPPLGLFDAAVSSMAIHHLEHERKRSLYSEVFGLLRPGGVFANFEHVASPTRRLHTAFFAAIDESLEDEGPSDRLLGVETQLTWLRDIGFDDVDCYWKWLEMALLIGVRPANQPSRDARQTRRPELNRRRAARRNHKSRQSLPIGRTGWLSTRPRSV
jgi:SAM-dependent methyltransferase